MAACVAALEAELTKSLEEAVRLEEKNGELEEQLSALGEKVGVRPRWWWWWWWWPSTYCTESCLQ